MFLYSCTCSRCRGNQRGCIDPVFQVQLLVQGKRGVLVPALPLPVPDDDILSPLSRHVEETCRAGVVQGSEADWRRLPTRVGCWTAVYTGRSQGRSKCSLNWPDLRAGEAEERLDQAGRPATTGRPDDQAVYPYLWASATAALAPLEPYARKSFSSTNGNGTTLE